MSTQKKNRKLVLHPEGNIIADSGRYALVEFDDLLLETDDGYFTSTGNNEEGQELELTDELLKSYHPAKDLQQGTYDTRSWFQKFIQWVLKWLK